MRNLDAFDDLSIPEATHVLPPTPRRSPAAEVDLAAIDRLDDATQFTFPESEADGESVLIRIAH